MTNKISRRAALRLLASGAGAALLVACGGGEPPPVADLQDATPVPVAAPEKATAAAPIPSGATAAPASTTIPTSSTDNANTLTLWHYDDQLKLVVQGFEQANPGVKVDIKSYWPNNPYLTDLRTSLKDGKGAPDLAVMYGSELAELVAAGGLADLAAAPFDGSKLEKNMVEQLWAQAMVDGKLYGVPMAVEPIMLWYRADALKTAGFESEPEQVAAKAQTWEDMLALGQALKAKKDGLALVPDAIQIFWAAVNQQGGGLFDGTRVLIRKKGLRPATLAAEARKRKLDANTDANDPAVLLRRGLVVGLLASPRAHTFLAQTAPETSGSWRAIPVPEGPYLDGGAFMVLPEQSKKHELAWKLAQYLCATAAAQNASLKATGSFPAFKPAWDDPLYDQPEEFFGGQPVYRSFVEVVQKAPASAISQYDHEAGEAVMNELRQMLFSNGDPEKAMANAEAEVLRKVPGATAGS